MDMWESYMALHQGVLGHLRMLLDDGRLAESQEFISASCPLTYLRFGEGILFSLNVC